MMKPLPNPEVIPPHSETYQEANSNRDKLKVLKNNCSMMQFELTKICKKFRIGTLDRYVVVLLNN